MKTKLTTIAITACIATASQAATVSFRPGGSRPAAGVPYDWQISMDGTDSATASRHVGAWSWEDNALFDATAGDPTVGWTHTSDWTMLTLTNVTSFTVRLERAENVLGASALSPSMFPSFTLFSGTDQDGDQIHTYYNRDPGSYADYSAGMWAEDLTYIDHINNSTETFVEKTFTLGAGTYTLALGSNAPATDSERQGYLLTVTTVPEPTTSLLSTLGVIALIARRRR